MSRCTGHCCQRFPLPLRLADLTVNAQAALRGEDVDANGRKRISDIVFIHDMVVPLGEPKTYPNGDEGEYYTCRHLNKETGDCTVYEKRPRMCSEYPYGGACDYVGRGCTMEPLVQIGAAS